LGIIVILKEGDIMSNFNGNRDNELTNDENKYPILLWIACYFTALFVVGLIGLIAPIAGLEKGFELIGKSFPALKVLFFFGLGFTWLYFGKNLGDYWRSNTNELGTGITNIPNVFYDPNFKKGPFSLQRDYFLLRMQYKKLKSDSTKLQAVNEKLIEDVHFFQQKLGVFLRHHDNTNRIISSLNYFTNTREKSEYIQRLLKDILTECITILQKNQSDKSITLFQIEGDKLIIKEYVRINVNSFEKRTFKIGEGFAGSIWETKEDTIINQIDYEDPRFGSFKPNHQFRSILGVPLLVDQTMFGVLCIQSEISEGFHEDDLRTVKFYAHMCTLLLQYDKMNSNNKGG
jgi:putative methionine-R-sulfoxide reductase with GAF domain